MLTINLIILLLRMSIKAEGTNMLANMLEYKVIVVGDKGVGKSALVRRFCTDQFVEVNIMEFVEPSYLFMFSGVFNFTKCSKSKNPFCWKQKN